MRAFVLIIIRNVQEGRSIYPKESFVLTGYILMSNSGGKKGHFTDPYLSICQMKSSSNL